MRLIVDLVTVAVVGFTTVVAAWMVVNGLRRTRLRLMLVVAGTTAVAGLVQWLGPPVVAEAGPPAPVPATDGIGATVSPTIATPSWTVPPPPTDVPSRTVEPTEVTGSVGPDAAGGPTRTVEPRVSSGSGGGGSAGRQSLREAPVPSAATDPDEQGHRHDAGADTTRGASR